MDNSTPVDPNASTDTTASANVATIGQAPVDNSAPVAPVVETPTTQAPVTPDVPVEQPSAGPEVEEPGEAVEETETPVVTNPVTTPTTAPVVPTANAFEPNQVDTNNALAKVVNEVEQLMDLAGRLIGPSYNTSGLMAHLTAARDWAAKEMGLVYQNGVWFPAGTEAQPQVEVSEGEEVSE